MLKSRAKRKCSLDSGVLEFYYRKQKSFPKLSSGSKTCVCDHFVCTAVRSISSIIHSPQAYPMTPSSFCNICFRRINILLRRTPTYRRPSQDRDWQGLALVKAKSGWKDSTAWSDPLLGENNGDTKGLLVSTKDGSRLLLSQLSSVTVLPKGSLKQNRKDHF